MLDRVSGLLNFEHVNAVTGTDSSDTVWCVGYGDADVCGDILVAGHGSTILDRKDRTTVKVLSPGRCDRHNSQGGVVDCRFRAGVLW